MPSFNLGNFRRSHGLSVRSSSFQPRCTTTSLLEAADAAIADKSRRYTSPDSATHLLEGVAEYSSTETNASGNRGKCRVVCARWWVLLMYCLLAATQAATWNTFSPIYPAVYAAFPSWDSTYINWLINATNVSFLIMLWPAAHLAQKIGVRAVTIGSSIIVVLCAGFRCLPLEDNLSMRVIMMLSMLCNGAGGAWTGFGGPVLSELWFPVSQRTMATALGITATAAGSSLGFVVGPAIVGTPTNQTDARAAIDRLFYWEAAVAAANCIGILAYFPNKPRDAPSEAAALKRRQGTVVDGEDAYEPRLMQPVNTGIYFSCCCCCAQPQRQQIESGDEVARRSAAMWGEFAGAMVGQHPIYSRLQKKVTMKYWIVAGALAIPLGVFQAWSSVLYSCIADTNVTQDEAAWLGFTMTMSGCLGSVVVAIILDRFLGYLKAVSTALMVVAVVSFMLFSANAAGWIPGIDSRSQAVDFMFATGIIGGMALNTAVPLYFELIMESVYGWGDEGTGAMFAIAVNTLVQIFFLIILAEEPDDWDPLWTAWATAGSIVMCAAVMTFFRAEYRRLSVDRGTPLAETGCAFDRALGCY